MNVDVLVPALQVFVAEIDARWPNRSRASDGSIASAAHSAGNPTSDHEPGPPGSPSPGRVDAVDITRRGVDMRLICDRFEKHAGSRYWIHEDMISFRSEGWRPRSYAYAGPNRNRHFEHGHFNLDETRSAHTNVKPYGIEEPMPTAEEIAEAVWEHELTDPRTGKPKKAKEFLRYNDVTAISGAADALKHDERIGQILDAVTDQSDPPPS